MPIELTGIANDTLRALELVQPTTDESRNGTFLHDSIALLFRLIYDGFDTGRQTELRAENQSQFHTFRLRPLRTHLFDPRRTPILNRVKLRNATTQKILRLLSLSRPKSTRERPGRISYAQLGINQIGAVYEALLSFSGFFAKTDLYEVKMADETWDELAPGHFVPAEDLPRYSQAEQVFNDDVVGAAVR